ncbi:MULTISPECIES: putative signal transducing protein [Porphyromonadaceae]|uniref:DUF2007 domain-containing protein n=1 Tax=Sanguibacteroides justesenii TaxID=1547597 RepID=A0A0C3RFR8_9PORP|nr:MULTISPECIES: DUF2007 domain-containing protein [Porphyromonadaceae]KIO44164.1 hypothetical protein BA92_12375 [Sanguibacteroides justesenii]KIO47178.1 hypothetical protein IE90_00865 [Sanguibacteroides justesenii]PXZ43808.1 DUF2007 domain-containing protein [Sanguibacteroides justesenii]
MDNWVSVFTTNEEFEAERIKELLSDSNIPAVILNQKDSSYIMLGEVNVMVNKEHKEEAEKVIKNKNDRE